MPWKNSHELDKLNLVAGLKALEVSLTLSGFP